MDKVRRRSRLLPSVQLELWRLFVAGVSAQTAAELAGVNRNTAMLYFHRLRELIAEKRAEQSPFLDGEIEIDESYFARAFSQKWIPALRYKMRPLKSLE